MAVAVNTGASAQIVAARLQISVEEVQEWARQYGVDPKTLTRSQREENEIVSGLLQHSTSNRYPSDFRGRVAVVVRSGVSALAVAARLGLAVEAVQKWAIDYGIERKQLTKAQAEKELASLQAELGSMERQVHQRLLEALADPAGSAASGSGSSSGSCNLASFPPITPGTCSNVPRLPATVPPQWQIY